ncbi:MAG: Ppx/GppA phosphatase family protein [Microthrixaceae bacterium]
MSEPLYAAIDCGTNSTRVLVSDGERTVAREMRITRLGQGVDATGHLAPEAIERTLAVLREYASLLESHDVAGLRVAATSAARDAENSGEFFGPARELLGVEPELLSGREEAELSFLGATSGLPVDGGPYLVVDIGGGSTEFAVGGASVAGSLSTQMGCVRLSEKYLHHDPPLPEELSNCLAEVEFHVDQVRRTIPMAASANRLVGLAGTVTTVAAVEIGLMTYDPEVIHHFELTKAAAEDVFRTLATEALEDRIHNPGLEEQRADVIVGGCCVLVGIMRNLGFDECLVSEADILDGLVLSQVRAAQPAGDQQGGGG